MQPTPARSPALNLRTSSPDLRHPADDLVAGRARDRPSASSRATRRGPGAGPSGRRRRTAPPAARRSAPARGAGWWPARGATSPRARHRPGPRGSRRRGGASVGRRQRRVVHGWAPPVRLHHRPTGQGSHGQDAPGKGYRPSRSTEGWTDPRPMSGGCSSPIRGATCHACERVGVSRPVRVRGPRASDEPGGAGNPSARSGQAHRLHSVAVEGPGSYAD